MFAQSHSRPVEAGNSAPRFWQNTKNYEYSSPISKILHDPECQDRCCAPSAFEGHGQVQGNLVHVFENSVNRRVELNMSTQNKYPNQILHNSTVRNTVTPSTQFQNSCMFSHGEYSQAYIKPEWNQRNFENSAKKSYCKGVVKRKRKRTAFTTEQIVALEEVFKKRPYVSLEERRFLTEKLHVSEKAIKIWFQNRRRLTEKREREQSESYHSDSTTEDAPSNNVARLDYIESHLYQTTDEKGFVTLDNTAISELVTVIDNALSPNIDWNISLYEKDENVKQNPSYLMYEPISPVSLSEQKESEDISKWQPSIPEESLQRLLDIQSALFTL